MLHLAAPPTLSDLTYSAASRKRNLPSALRNEHVGAARGDAALAHSVVGEVSGAMAASPKCNAVPPPSVNSWPEVLDLCEAARAVREAQELDPDRDDRKRRARAVPSTLVATSTPTRRTGPETRERVRFSAHRCSKQAMPEF